MSQTSGRHNPSQKQATSSSPHMPPHESTATHEKHAATCMWHADAARPKHLRCSVPTSRLAMRPRVIDRKAYRRGCGGWRMLTMSIGDCLPCTSHIYIQPSCLTSHSSLARPRASASDSWLPVCAVWMPALMTACNAVGRSHMPVLADSALPEPAGSSAIGTRAAACQSDRVSMPCSTACCSILCCVTITWTSATVTTRLHAVQTYEGLLH